MITLITGTPGAGKTAWTVQELTRLPAQRKVFVHGIPELKIAHEPIYCRSELCDLCNQAKDDDEVIFYSHVGPFGPLPANRGWPVITGRLYVEDWPLWATHGSLIVIDEVQRIWRPTASGAKLGDDISRLETHRHSGLDFWLISQGPHLFHSNVRLLIGKHIHLVSKWNGRSEYEWPECRQNVTSRSDAVTRPYTLPKKVFGLYKSASLHVKQSHRKPLAFYGFVCSLALLVVFGYLSYQRVASRSSSEQVTQSGAGVATAAGATAGAHGDGGAPVPDKPKPSAGVSEAKVSSFPDFTPTVPGVPESAPAYAELLKVKDVPLLKGCIQSKEKCTCYTHQGTVYPTTAAYCAETIKGHRFNPYWEKTPETAQQQVALNSATSNEKD